MRAFWSGEIVWHLIHVPCKLYTSSKEGAPQFHHLHKKCGARITVVRRCESCGIDVAWEDIGKGHEVARGEYVLFTSEELRALKDLDDDGAGVIELLHTTRPEGINPVHLDTTYWVGPGAKRAKAYETLRDALSASGLVAIASVTLRTRPRLCMLGVVADLITLTTLHYHEEVVSAAELVPPPLEVAAREREMAIQLLSAMEGPYEADKHTDQYVRALLAAVDEKVEGGQVVVEGQAPVSGSGKKDGPVVDLAALLRESLGRAEELGTGGEETAQGRKEAMSEEKRDCRNCGNRCMDMDLDPYCSAVNPPWGRALYTGKPEECGPESKLWTLDTRGRR